jgi:hypothetical protein
MAAEQYTEATAELVKLLGKTEGGRGQIVYNLPEKLNADFTAPWKPAIGRRLLPRRAAPSLADSGELAANNLDANIKKFTYRYRVFGC